MEKYLVRKWIKNNTVLAGLFKIEYNYINKKYVAKIPMRLPDLSILGFILEGGQVKWCWEKGSTYDGTYVGYIPVFSEEKIPDLYYQENSTNYILEVPDDDSARLWFMLEYGEY